MQVKARQKVQVLFTCVTLHFNFGHLVGTLTGILESGSAYLHFYESTDFV